MTLLEILVQELPKRGGWPYKYNVAHTDGGRLKIVFAGPNLLNFAAPWSDEVDISTGDTLITRERYEAALAASKTTWNGEGLPPVGCECEAKYGSPTAEWFYFKCVSVDCGVAFGWAGKEPVVLQGSVYEFRPIRSEADRKRDETVKWLHEVFCSTPGYCEEGFIAVYDAIAAGKIPHLKIV